MSPTDLIAELRAALDADEAAARAAAEQGDDPTWHMMNDGFDNKVAYGSSAPRSEAAVARTTHSAYAAHIVRHGPAFVLADIAAKRAVLDLHVPVPGWDGRLTDRNPHRDPVCAICADYDRDGLPTGDPYPCTTLRLLAEAYGITEEERNA